MNNVRTSLHSKVHHWIDAFGFRLNESQTNNKNNVTTNHYFFKTFSDPNLLKNNFDLIARDHSNWFIER